MSDPISIVQKDPDDVLDYGLDYSTWLDDNQTITSSSWTISSDDESPVTLTEDSSSSDNTSAKIVLSGGTDGITYHLLNEISTDDGKTKQASLLVRVQEV